MTDDPLDAMKARWSYIQGFLFPWMREDNDPITEALGRVVTTDGGRGQHAGDRDLAAGHVDVEFVPGPGLFVALAVFLAADVAGGGQVGEHLAEVLHDLPLETRRLRLRPLFVLAWTSALARLMDAAYDAAAIHDQSRALGHAPIVDRNFRADHEGKAKWGREVERLKLIHMPDFDDLIYDFRTMAERVNARLKDEFGARFLRVRGALKVKCHLMFGIVALAVDQITRVVNYRTAPAFDAAGFAPPGPGKIHLAQAVLQEAQTFDKSEQLD